MNCSKVKIILAVCKDDVRQRLVEVLKGAGYSRLQVTSPLKVRQGILGSDEDTVLFLETNDDVAALNQIVYDLHNRGFHRSGVIIGIVSQDALDRNPSVGLWAINGRAALDILMVIERDEFDRLPLFIERVSRTRSHAD